MFIAFPRLLVKGKQHAIQIFYNGKPPVARRPPWDGGFTWTQDSTGNPWVVVTCQGTGASL
jgi:aminopeptidase N